MTLCSVSTAVRILVALTTDNTLDLSVIRKLPAPTYLISISKADLALKTYTRYQNCLPYYEGNLM